MKAHPLLCVAIKEFGQEEQVPEVRVYYPPQVLIIDWFLEIRHKGGRLKVPFAVTRHKYCITLHFMIGSLLAKCSST